MLDRIKEVIKAEINPKLALHRGSVEALKYENGIVTLRFQGGCAGCPSAKLTLVNGVVPILQRNFPEIEEIELA